MRVSLFLLSVPIFFFLSLPQILSLHVCIYLFMPLNKCLSSLTKYLSLLFVSLSLSLFFLSIFSLAISYFSLSLSLCICVCLFLCLSLSVFLLSHSFSLSTLSLFFSLYFILLISLCVPFLSLVVSYLRDISLSLTL